MSRKLFELVLLKIVGDLIREDTKYLIPITPSSFPIPFHFLLVKIITIVGTNQCSYVFSSYSYIEN